MKVKESLNVTFDETPPPPKTSTLKDEDLVEEEAIKVNETRPLANDNKDKFLENNEIINIKESKSHPLENVIGNLNQRTLRSQAEDIKMLKKFRLEDSKLMKTLMSAEMKLTKDEEGESVDNTKYRGTTHLELWYPKGPDIETVVYADSDHVRDYRDRKSTSGICTFMGCCLTSWFLKKKTVLTISTTEAEYVSTEKACQQALWMKQAIVNYGIRLDDIPIMCDNKGAIDLSKNSVQHSRTKHIKIHHHFLHSNFQKGNISIEKTDGEAMINSIQNGDQPLPVIALVSLAGTVQNASSTLKDLKFWTAKEKKTRKIDRLVRSLLIQRLSNDIYSLIDSNETAKDVWDALERQMRGFEYGEQDRKAAILYEYENFKANEGDQLLDNYLSYLQVINDLKKCGYKKDNYESLALVAEKIKASKQKEKVIVSSDSEGSGVDDFSELKKITAFLAKAFNRRKFYSKPTNNNLRTSSTSQSANKKQEFVDDKKEDKKADEKKRDMSKVKCYNCKKEGHFAKDCKKPEIKDYNYYKTNGVVERKNQTLVEVARTMLTFANLPLCYLLNKYKDVGKLKAKGHIEVFVGYSKESAAFRIYNKRTRQIHESANVNFDEISEMASKQFSLEPGLSNLNETRKSSNPPVSKVSEASKKDLEDLFQNFYDEYFDSSKIVKSSTTNVETSINEEVFHEVSKSFQGESSSSSLNDDIQQSSKEVGVPSSNTQSISNNTIPNVDVKEL
nr:copia protein [Tanacetum cinerariifolium]